MKKKSKTRRNKGMKGGWGGAPTIPAPSSVGGMKGGWGGAAPMLH